MSFRTSFSQNNTFIKCPKYWDWSYNHKIKSDVQAASLFFGSAIDAAVMEMLEGKTEYIHTFKDKWRRAYQYGKATQIFDNPDIVYSNADFDEHVLQDKDKDQMLLWAAELKLGDDSDVVRLFKEISKIKKSPYKHTTSEQMKYFSRCSWLSMKRKGEILINSFKEQFYPKIKKVLATQKYAKIENPYTGDVISGYVDMILEIEGESKPVIFDLKTAAQPYSQEQIDLTEQLTLYSAMKRDEYNTDRVGFIILCKNIPKESEGYCQDCGTKKEGRHKTCNATTSEGVRCEGEWLEKVVLKPVVQVLIESKTSEQIEELLKDCGNIILAMKNKIVYKNTNNCSNWYGSDCIYKKLCHKGSMIGLRKE